MDLVPPSPQEQGVSQDVQVTGVVPGDTVYLFRDGDQDPCPAFLAPSCFDLDGVAFMGSAIADGSGVAVFPVTVPVALDPTELAWQAGSAGCGLTEVEQTTAVSPVSCLYDPVDWAVSCDSGPMGCFLTGWFDVMYPAGMPAFGTSLTLDQVRVGLGGADVRSRAALALALSVDADDMGLFGARASVGDQVVPDGPYVGYTVREVAALAVATAPTSTSLGDTAIHLLLVHDTCGEDQLVMPGWPTYPPANPPGDSGVADSGVGDSAGDTGPSGDSGAVVDTGAPGGSGGAGGDSGGAVVDTGAPGDSGGAGGDSGVGGGGGAVGDSGTGDSAG